MAARTKTFFYNVVFSFIQQIFVFVAGFITPRIMLVYFGSEMNGLVNSILQFISYFTLVEAGLGSAAIVALYKPLAEKNNDEVSSIVSAARKFYNITGFIFTAFVIGLTVVYSLLVKNEMLSQVETGLLIMVLGLSGILEFFTMSKYRVLLTADQKVYLLSIINTIQVIIRTVTIVLATFFGANIVVVYALALISIFIRSLFFNIYTRIKYKHINYKAVPNKKALDKRWDALYVQILSNLQGSAPIIAATVLLGLLDVSIYVVYAIVINGISLILGVFTNGLGSSFGDVIAKNENKILKKTHRQFEFMYYNLLAFVFSVTFILIVPFVMLYTKDITDANYYQPLFAFVLVANTLLFVGRAPNSMLVISAGMFREVRLQNLFQGIIAFGGAFLFGYFFGLIGIILGPVLANVYRSIEIVFFANWKIKKTSIWVCVKMMVIMYVCIAIVYVPTLFLDLKIETVFSWIIHAVILSVYSLVVIIIVNFIFNRILLKETFSRLWSIFSKKTNDSKSDSI